MPQCLKEYRRRLSALYTVPSLITTEIFGIAATDFSPFASSLCICDTVRRSRNSPIMESWEYFTCLSMTSTRSPSFAFSSFCCSMSSAAANAPSRQAGLRIIDLLMLTRLLELVLSVFSAVAFSSFSFSGGTVSASSWALDLPASSRGTFASSSSSVSLSMASSASAAGSAVCSPVAVAVSSVPGSFTSSASSQEAVQSSSSSSSAHSMRLSKCCSIS
mmetsp:Transcript_81261/g.143323  ORF Transcript_81261/g.143323 Transcript_81261/m.143323 type:complete len:218 (-) Transcript_81261:299-952(-)